MKALIAGALSISWDTSSSVSAPIGCPVPNASSNTVKPSLSIPSTVSLRKECRGKSLEELLDEFAALRTQNLAALETLHLCSADLAKKGTHQRLGTVTLAQLLATWAAHDLTHLHQLSRVMAYQYRDAVGPWTAFLGVMHCTGHSAP